MRYKIPRGTPVSFNNRAIFIINQAFITEKDVIYEDRDVLMNDQSEYWFKLPCNQRSIHTMAVAPQFVEKLR